MSSPDPGKGNPPRKKVLIVGRIRPEGLALLTPAAGIDIEVLTDPDTPIPERALVDVDGLIVRYGVVTDAHLEHANRLKIVSRHGVGLDNLPLPSLASMGIPVTIVGPVNSVSVAEQTLALLMAVSRRITSYDRAVRDGTWSLRESLRVTELAGKTFLLLGFGRVGREVATRAKAFGMTVVVYDPFVSAIQVKKAGYIHTGDWLAMAPDADVLSVHLPLNKDTRHVINAKVLARMKPTAIILNTSRGGLIDETALYDALKDPMAEGGAGLDTFEVEPVAPTMPLLTLDNVVVSPHSAALSLETAIRMGTVAAQNVIDAFEDNLNPALVV